MKHYIFTMLLLCLCLDASAQQASWMWARKDGGTGNEHGQKITVSGGYVYVVGSFSSDTLVIGNDTLVNQGSGTSDVFVSKYDSLGNPVWAIGFSGADVDEGLDIASSNFSEGVYITGSYSSDSLVAGNITLMNSGTATREMFLISINHLGDVIWARDMGGTDAEEGRSVKADSFGNVYVTGGFSSSFTFAGNSLAPVGTGDVFLAKYDTAGNEIWAVSAGGNEYGEGNGVDVDGLGNIYITGMYYSDPILFGNNITLTNFGDGDGFIARYDSTGVCLWARHMGGSLYDESNAVLVDPNTNGAYITGAFKSPVAAFDNSSDILNNSGNTNSKDVFVAYYSPSGNGSWTDHPGGTGDETGYDLAFYAPWESSGLVFVIGTTESPALHTGWEDSLVTNGGSDAFVLIFVGNVIIGGAAAEYGLGIATKYPYFYCTGGFESPVINFDNIPVSNAGGSDIFVARYYTDLVTIPFLNKAADGQVAIYPNPTQDAFTVLLPENAQHLQIVNITGQVVLSEGITGKSKVAYKLQNGGLYFVMVTTQTGKIVGKVLVEN